MIRWLKKLFGQFEKSQLPPCTWLEIGPDNPFDVRVLDVRPVTQTMTSLTSSQEIAMSFVRLRESDGSDLQDIEIENAELFSCDMTISVPIELKDGPLFKAAEMEDKWDIYTYSSIFYFARSWQGTLIYKVPYRVKDGAVQIDEIESAPDHTHKADQYVFFLLTSHVLGQQFPNPIPEDLGDTAEPIAMLSFISFGRMAICATYSDVTCVSVVNTSESTGLGEHQGANKMPAGLILVLVFSFLSAIVALILAGLYPSYFVFFFAYGIAGVFVVVGALRRSKPSWYLLILVLASLILIHANTLNIALGAEPTEARGQLIVKKIIQIVPLTAAFFYVFTRRVRAYFASPNSTPFGPPSKKK